MSLKTVEYQLERNGKFGTIRIGMDDNAMQMFGVYFAKVVNVHEQLLRLGIFSDMKVIHERAFDDQTELEAK